LCSTEGLEASQHEGPAGRGRSWLAMMGLNLRRLSTASWILWAILVVAIAVSFRPSIPVIWGDSPAFVESALRTMEAERPIVAGGRDPGYPVLLALIFALGGDLHTVVVLQQAAWTILIVALAASAQILTRSAYALGPIIVVTLYPGVLMFRNIITAETIYLVLLTLAVLALLLATHVETSIRGWLVAGSILLAALAACCKSQGLLVLAATIPLGLWIILIHAPRRLAPIALSSAAALMLVATLSRAGATPSDRTSVVFVAKTLFCNHLNIVLASQAARHELAAAAGERTSELLARLSTDFASKRDRWPTLQFFGDECLYDTGLDQYFTAAGTDPSSAPPQAVAAIYWRIFLAAVRDHPLLYVGKIARQMAYGAALSWPPYGLGPTVPVSTDDVPHVAEIMSSHGRQLGVNATPDRPIQGWILGNLGGLSTWLFSSLSASFVIAAAFGIITVGRRHRPRPSVQAGLVIALWGMSILPSAAAHTLDVWRYLVPSTPMVSLLLSLVGVELANAVGAYQGKARAAGKFDIRK
jgi:hypothetical protein